MLKLVLRYARSFRSLGVFDHKSDNSSFHPFETLQRRGLGDSTVIVFGGRALESIALMRFNASKVRHRTSWNAFFSCLNIPTSREVIIAMFKSQP